MAMQFLVKHTRVQGLTHAPQLTSDAQHALLAYHWPGNVRELDNVIQRALVLSHGDEISSAHLMFDDLEGGTQATLDWMSVMPVAAPLTVVRAPVINAIQDDDEPIRLQDAVKTNEHQMILRAIETSPTKAEAAKRLGISPRTLRYKMAQFRIAGAA
jgi:two-component system response regulator FlrC